MVVRLRRPADHAVGDASARIAASEDGDLPETPTAVAAEVEEIGEPLGVLVSRGGPLMGTEYVVGGSR